MEQILIISDKVLPRKKQSTEWDKLVDERKRQMQEYKGED